VCEGQTDEQLVEGATEVLRRIHPETQVPQATKWAVTRWGGDKWARGAYSYVAVRKSLRALALEAHQSSVQLGDVRLNRSTTVAEGASQALRA
jgi:hypothetical protein